ncbi:DUF5983 family protein [Sphingomonas sp. YL-JM2C]
MPSLTKQDHLHLLARARAVLECPADFDSSDIRVLVEDLYAAEERLETEEVPWSLDIHVGTIDHKEGNTIYATFSRATLMAEMAVFCREWWKDADIDVDYLTLSDEEIVQTYFNDRSEDFYTTDKVSLSGPDAIGPPAIETDRLLVLCTSHLRKDTADRLEQWAHLPADDRPLAVADTGYGFVVRKPVPGRAADTDIPKELIAALGLARQRGCHGILYDRDASLVDMLETFEW